MLHLRKNRMVQVAVAITLFAATLSSAFPGTTAVALADSGSTLAATEHKVLVQAAFDDVLNGHDVSAVAGPFAENFVQHDDVTPNVALGQKGMAFRTSYYRHAFPDLKYTVEDVIAEGDRVVTRRTATGTQAVLSALLPPPAIKSPGRNAPSGRCVTARSSPPGTIRTRRGSWGSWAAKGKRPGYPPTTGKRGSSLYTGREEPGGCPPLWGR